MYRRGREAGFLGARVQGVCDVPEPPGHGCPMREVQLRKGAAGRQGANRVRRRGSAPADMHSACVRRCWKPASDFQAASRAAGVPTALARYCARSLATGAALAFCIAAKAVVLASRSAVAAAASSRVASSTSAVMGPMVHCSKPFCVWLVLPAGPNKVQLELPRRYARRAGVTYCPDQELLPATTVRIFTVHAWSAAGSRGLGPAGTAGRCASRLNEDLGWHARLELQVTARRSDSGDTRTCTA